MSTRHVPRCGTYVFSRTPAFKCSRKRGHTGECIGRELPDPVGDSWHAWADRACTDLGALLAEMIGREPANVDIAEARRLMIQAESLLAGVVGR